MMYII